MAASCSTTLPWNLPLTATLAAATAGLAARLDFTLDEIEDLRIAAHVLGDERIADGVRVLVIPATQRVWQQANEEGLLDRFAAAGAAVSTPTCGNPASRVTSRISAPRFSGC